MYYSFFPFFYFRFLKKNVALWGLWRGKEKPVMHAFLKPLVIALNSISKNGMYVKFYFLSCRQT